MEKENKKMNLAEQLTYSTVLIKCTYLDGASGSGTGFIMNLCRNGDICIPVIITNNHVVINAKTVEFEFCMQNEDGTPNDFEAVKIRIDQYQWIKHPDNNVDLCCMLIGPIINNLNQQNKKIFYIPIDTKFIPSMEDDEKMSAMEEMVMIGYPIGLMDNYNHKPIIRRGTTATHYKKDYQGQKEFLLDMACFPGSSGSPIFILKEGPYCLDGALYSGNYLKFVGVLYGGPQYNVQGNIVVYSTPTVVSNTLIPTNLGIAIKSERILEFEAILKK